MSDAMSSHPDYFQPLVQCIRDYYGVQDADAGFIPLHIPSFDDTEKAKVADCIDSTFVSSVGQYVTQFEEEIAAYTGAKHAVAVTNGTMGLFLALKSLGVQAGDLVITQSLTFVATPNAIKMTGAEPLFLDVSKQTMGLSAQALANFLQTETEQQNGRCVHKATGQRIAACMPMHTLGFACEIEAIVALCRQHNLNVVEDSAESLGSFVDDQHTGTLGDFGVFSFNGNKILTTGGGGMLVTNDDDLAKQAKHLSTTAKVPHAWLFEHDEVAFNLRMPNLNAALGVAQLSKLKNFLKQKRELAENYQKQAKKQPGLVVFGDENTPNSTLSNYWLNAIICADQAERDAFLQFTNDQGIQTRPLWTPMHQLEIYQAALRADDLSNTEWLAQRVVNLPSSVQGAVT